MCNSRKIPVFSHIPRPVVLATFVLFLSTGNLANAAGAERHLTILHTNDLLGRLLPEPYLGQSDWGGFARLAHVIDQERGARRDSLLVLDGGDALGDTPISALDAGRTVVELMNQMKYDAMVVGNHEFDYGLDSLYARRLQANFDLLGANVRVESDRQPLTTPFVLKKRAGLSVAVIGLLSPDAEKLVNPLQNPDLDIRDPHTTLQTLLNGPAGRADLRVVLVHMSAGEARDLALAFPEVELWIAGSYARVTPAGAFEHVVRIEEGGYVVTTPGRGIKLGRVDLRVWREGTDVVVLDVRPTLVRVDPDVPPDGNATLVINRQRETLRRAMKQTVGHVSGPITDATQWVADLIRNRLDTEISMINHGALRELILDGEIQRGTLQRLVRYDDDLVRVELTGRQLTAVAVRSGKRTRKAQQLVFSGYDPGPGLVGGRKLSPQEKYQVGTTSFLASGGDGYLSGKAFPDMINGDPNRLFELIETHLREYPKMGRWDGLRRGGRGVWKNRTKLNGSLSRTSVDAAAERYSGVSFLGGDDALAWIGQLEFDSSYDSPRGTLAALLRTGFGQVRAPGQRREAVDRLDVEGRYTWTHRRTAPFLGSDVNTVWTAPPGEEHPLTIRLKGGVYRTLGTDAGVHVGLAAERDLVARENVAGLEVSPKFRMRLGPGSVLSSEAKLFWGASRKRTLSFQSFNSLQIRLPGNLAATLDANLFLHRDNQVGALANKSELHFGLGYTWNWKRH